MLNLRAAVCLGFLLSIPALGDLVNIGNLSILADSPFAGLQELTINNLTGGNCSADYPACKDLNFTNWTLAVSFSSSYYNTAGNPSLANPFVATSATYGDITPNSTNNTFDFDLCGGVNFNNSCAPATTITSVLFSGQIFPASFCLFDSTVQGCNNTAPETFFANPNFSLVWNGSSAQTPYVDEDNVYAVSPDITVTNQTLSTAPEPGSYLVLIGLSLGACLIRLKYAAR